MKVKIILIIIIVFSVQAKMKMNLFTGTKLGLNFLSNYQYNTSNSITPTGAIITEFYIFKPTSVSLGFIYTQRKWDIKNTDDENIPISTDFLGIELAMRHRINIPYVKPYLLMGLYWEKFLSGSFTYNNEEYKYKSDEYIESTILGSICGLGAEYSFGKWGTVFSEGGLRIPFYSALKAQSNDAFSQQDGFFMDYFIYIGYKINVLGFF